MRTLFLLLIIFVIPCSAQIQTTPPVVVVADGGTSGRMESIFIPPIANAPFTLTLLTEWSRPLANGGTYALTNQRRIARDGKGRIYDERWLLVPKGRKVPSFMDVRQFADPSRHTLYNCFTDGKVCQLLPYTGSTQAVYKPATSPTGPLPDGTGFHSTKIWALRDGLLRSHVLLPRQIAEQVGTPESSGHTLLTAMLPPVNHGGRLGFLGNPGSGKKDVWPSRSNISVRGRVQRTEFVKAD